MLYQLSPAVTTLYQLSPAVATLYQLSPAQKQCCSLDVSCHDWRVFKLQQHCILQDSAVNYDSLMQCRRAAKFSDQQFEQDFVKAIQPLL